MAKRSAAMFLAELRCGANHAYVKMRVMATNLRKPQKYKTCKRFNDPGHAHSLTFTCFHRQALLSRERSCHWFLESLAQARTKHRFDL
ncbi:MAG: hypothetical protein MI923_06155 [Phycisphaerales bacterium]|nr:hypothetical protein [Phycisphaerales bacterium]